jgi:O-antigen/teichoic acid export membrane protein
LAYPLTLAVLGSKWEGAAVIFAGFTVAALTYPLTTASTWLFASQGRGRDLVMNSGLVSLITLVSFAAGLPFGPAGVAISYSASCLLIQLPIVFHLAGKRGPVQTKDLWLGFIRHLPVWGFVCIAAWSMRFVVQDFHPWMQLVICGPVGLLVGAAFVCVSAPSRRVAKNLLSLIRDLKSKGNISV